MTALRSLLFLALMSVFTVVFVACLLLVFWLPPFRRHLLSRWWVAVAMKLVRHVLGIRYTLVGAENIPPGACIVLCKHQSAWETIALQEIFPGAVFVMKRELYWVPFFGWGLALMPMIAIDRSAGKDALDDVTGIRVYRKPLRSSGSSDEEKLVTAGTEATFEGPFTEAQAVWVEAVNEGGNAYSATVPAYLPGEEPPAVV